jgi:ferredoxin
MAYKIIDTCTACGLCVPECPIDAISVGDPIYVVDDTCCDFEDCLVVCPVDAIVPVDTEGTWGNLEERQKG